MRIFMSKDVSFGETTKLQSFSVKIILQCPVTSPFAGCDGLQPFCTYKPERH